MDRLISERAVLGVINEAIRTGRFYYGKNQTIKEIKDIPSAQPKIGHWIFCEGIKGKDNVEKCSCCQSHWKEAVIYRKDTQEYLRTRLLYCPNCGAKMIEPQESEVEECK